jgi:succinoglycan biosynthesis transport protein ExoP
MELKNYLYILIRWTWLLLLCTLLGIGSGYIASRLVKPTYQASTKILISKDLSDQSSQFAAMNNQQLIDAYIQLLSSTSVIDEASRRLNYEINLTELGSVQQVRSTNVIEIIMVDGDPQRAAAIVNMLVEVLIEQNIRASGYGSTEENIKNKIDQVQVQIKTLQTQFNQISNETLQNQLKQINDRIKTLQDDIEKLNNESIPLAEKQVRLAQLQSLLNQYQQIRISLELVGKPALNSSDPGGDLRLQQLQSTLDYYQKIYLDLLDNLQAVQLAHSRNILTIDQIEKAIPPADPVRPQRFVYIMLGGIIGLMLAIGIIFIIEYLDETLKTPQDVQQALGIPVLGYIAHMQSVSKTKKDLPITWQLHPQTSETLYALRTNLEFAVAHHPLKTLLVLSVNESGKGKTNMAANLAISYAQSGSKVILLDTDLRNPSIHHYFGLANEYGFSDLLTDDSKTETAGKKVEGLDRMTVITGGEVSPATYRLLKPDKIVQILKILKQHSDVIIINAPSINFADSWVLASKAEGILLVIQSKVTHLSEARLSLEQLNRVGATILGAVLYQNHIPYNLAYYYRSVRYGRRLF